MNPDYDKYIPKEELTEADLEEFDSEPPKRINKKFDVTDQEMDELMKLCDETKRKLKSYSRRD